MKRRIILNMKRISGIILSILMIVVCFSCKNIKTNIPQNKSGNDRIELIVFAAASMTETLNEIKSVYEKENQNISITYNFDSSGTLLKQILAGADCDIFISAALKQMNSLDINVSDTENPDRNDFLIDGTRTNLLQNKVVLAVPDDNKQDINSFKDLLTDKLTCLAIGNSDVPVGAYTIEILDYLGKSVSEFERQGKITYGSNVKEVTTQVKEGTVDAGIIYATDAKSSNIKIVDVATSDMCRQVIYPVAILKATKHKDEAIKFLSYLKSDSAMNVFASVGFTRAR